MKEGKVDGVNHKGKSLKLQNRSIRDARELVCVARALAVTANELPKSDERFSYTYVWRKAPVSLSDFRESVEKFYFTSLVLKTQPSTDSKPSFSAKALCAVFMELALLIEEKFVGYKVETVDSREMRELGRHVRVTAFSQDRRTGETVAKKIRDAFEAVVKFETPLLGEDEEEDGGGDDVDTMSKKTLEWVAKMSDKLIQTGRANEVVLGTSTTFAAAEKLMLASVVIDARQLD